MGHAAAAAEEGASSRMLLELHSNASCGGGWGGVGVATTLGKLGGRHLLRAHDAPRRRRAPIKPGLARSHPQPTISTWRPASPAPTLPTALSARRWIRSGQPPRASTSVAPVLPCVRACTSSAAATASERTKLRTVCFWLTCWGDASSTSLARPVLPMPQRDDDWTDAAGRRRRHAAWGRLSLGRAGCGLGLLLDAIRLVSKVV